MSCAPTPGASTCWSATSACPARSGYDLIEAVRKRLKVDARHLPAVALTAFTRREDSARALDKGFQKHLAKPVQVGRLIGAIRQLTGRQQTARGAAQRSASDSQLQGLSVSSSSRFF